MEHAAWKDRMEAMAPAWNTHAGQVPLGWPEADAALGGGLPRSGLHEWWGEQTHVRAVLVHAAWRLLLDADRRGVRSWVAWIGGEAWPQPEHLVRGTRAWLARMFGGAIEAGAGGCMRAWPHQWPDARMHERSIMVDVPEGDRGARLWAVEQAARCRGLCAVIADARGFDMAATRRLQLAARDVPVLAWAGPARRRSGASAAATRWSVEEDPGPRPIPWLRGAHALAERIPPEPAWWVRLERARGRAVDPSCMPVDRAVASWQWEGVAEPPAAVQRTVQRRARRVAEAMHRTVDRSGGASAVRPRAAAPDAVGATASPSLLSRRLGRGRDRMTSRGERWAMHVRDDLDSDRAA
jgi:hypothetical protein